MQNHLETFLALCHDDWEEERVSPHAERELQRYLECGILAYGFARARCDNCGHGFLIAFSCKGRGVCPSCNTRRIAPARGPPEWEGEDGGVEQDNPFYDAAVAQAEPEYDAQGSASAAGDRMSGAVEFDQRVSW